MASRLLHRLHLYLKGSKLCLKKGRWAYCSPYCHTDGLPGSVSSEEESDRSCLQSQRQKETAGDVLQSCRNLLQSLCWIKVLQTGPGTNRELHRTSFLFSSQSLSSPLPSSLTCFLIFQSFLGPNMFTHEEHLILDN